MSQVQIFEIEDEDSDEEYYTQRRPKYSTIVLEEEYEDEDQPKGWDIHEDDFFPVQ
jgi:hypothetical protein